MRAGLTNARPPRAASTAAMSGSLPQHKSGKPPLPPPQRTASDLRPIIDDQPGYQPLQGSVPPQTLPQPRTISQQQPGTSSTPGRSRLAEAHIPQLTSLSPVLRERTSAGPFATASRAPARTGPSQQLTLAAGGALLAPPAPAAWGKRSSNLQDSTSEAPGSYGGLPQSAQTRENTQAGVEVSSQPSKRQRIAGHEEQGEPSGAHEKDTAGLPSIQVPSRAAEAVDLAAKLDKVG